MFVAQLSGGNQRGVRKIKNSSRRPQAIEGNRLSYETLVYSGYSILLARTGPGAIKATKEHAPDIVLLEIDLSDMEGIDVLSAIRENPVRAGTPTLQSVRSRTWAMCLDCGCNGFIQKPIKALGWQGAEKSLLQAAQKDPEARRAKNRRAEAYLQYVAARRLRLV